MILATLFFPMKDREMASFNILPPELHSLIAGFLSIPDYLRLAQLSRYWHSHIGREKERRLISLPLWVATPSKEEAFLFFGFFTDTPELTLASIKYGNLAVRRFTFSLPLLHSLQHYGRRSLLVYTCHIWREEHLFYSACSPFALVFPSSYEDHLFLQRIPEAKELLDDDIDREENKGIVRFMFLEKGIAELPCPPTVQYLVAVKEKRRVGINKGQGGEILDEDDDGKQGRLLFMPPTFEKHWDVLREFDPTLRFHFTVADAKRIPEEEKGDWLFLCELEKCTKWNSIIGGEGLCITGKRVAEMSDKVLRGVARGLMKFYRRH